VITGTVVANLLGLPVSGATVSLSPGGLTTTTNGSGVYSFPNVVAGTYTLSVSAALYQTSSQTVTVAAGQTLTVNMRLRNLLGL
ncbi:MAG TPA: carboxypeptidase regulatory-like domain-containing protein, partial [Acidimicrobiales bacterium]